MNYKIERPLLSKKFWLPSRNNLLGLKPGNLVKLIFTPIDSSGGERMWVIIIKQNSEWEWEGILDNDPIDTLKDLVKSGDVIKFHPLDIIQIYQDSLFSKMKNLFLGRGWKKYITKY